MVYSFEITPRPAHLGGGWRLRLLENGEEVGGGVFPAAPADQDQVDAAYADAEEEAYAWLDAHDQVTIKLVHGQLVAFLPDRRTLTSSDAVHLAELLLDAGVSVDQVRMPDWQDDSAPLSGHKAAILARMRA